jgi:hypothetical protein
MKQNLSVRLKNENLTISVKRGKRTVTKSGEIRLIKLKKARTSNLVNVTQTHRRKLNRNNFFFYFILCFYLFR